MDVWEQHEGEPDEAYVRFLYYRNLGPTRSLDDAYLIYIVSGEVITKEKGVTVAPKRTKTPRANGQWKEDSRTYQWEFRANQWDIHILSLSGRSVIDNFYKFLSAHSFMLLEMLRDGKIMPESYDQLLEGMRFIGSFVSPEAIGAWRDVAGGNSPATEPEGQEPGGNISSINSKRDDRPAGKRA